MQVVADLKGRAGGFYTEEIRSQGTRLGFSLVTLDGKRAVLSHVNFNKRYRVGKYGVDIDSLDRVGVSALQRAIGQCDLVVIDEIGKMELLSANFSATVRQIISSGKKVLGTIMLDSNPWADDIKRQPQVKVMELTRTNRRQVQDELQAWLTTEL